MLTLGSAYTITANDLGNNKTISITANVFEALSSGIQNSEIVTIDAIITDIAGNSTVGSASNTTITVDQELPTMSITSTTSGVSDGSTTNDSSISLTFTSSENTSNFEESDISLTNINISNFASTNSKVYTATFTPINNGDCIIKVNANKFTDIAGNGNSVTDEFNWKFDNVRPTISSVTSTTSNGSYKKDDQINITITFSEAVTLSSNTGDKLIVTLETGNNDRTLEITSISNSLNASSTYTVQDGDSSK